MGAGKMQSVERRNSGEELFIFRTKGRVSSINNLAKGLFALTGTNGYKICTGLGVIIPFQANRPPVVFLRFIIHSSIPVGRTVGSPRPASLSLP